MNESINMKYNLEDLITPPAKKKKKERGSQVDYFSVYKKKQSFIKG